MTELERLIKELRNAADSVADCCGCNIYLVDSGIDALEDYLKERGTM